MNLYDEALSKALWIKFNKDIKVDEIIKAIEHAKKEHELLGLYRKRDRNIDHLTCSQIAKLDDEIDELEKEFEELK